MHNPILMLYDKWRERRTRRAQSILQALKVQYHTFRILLTNNEISLDLLRSVDQSLRSPVTPWDDLSEQTEELLSVTYELVDGLNRLTADRYTGLYQRHRTLSDAIRKTIESLAARPPKARRCIFLDDLSSEYRTLVGSKASTLGLLKSAGFPVPDGFAVTAQACDDLLVENSLDVYIRRRLQRFENRRVQSMELDVDASDIRSRILDAELPPELEEELRASYERITSGASIPISVRSSALVEDRPEHSFAGQFKSVLNVVSFEGLKEAFKEVIASNFSVRSVTYRLYAGLPLASHDMAVLCQRMVPAAAAGGLFTVDPASPESGRMLASGVPGLGILAVSGSAPADLYRPLRDAPDREPMSQWVQIASKTVRAVHLPGGGIHEEEVPAEDREKPVLSEEELLSLVRHGRRIESLIGKPQDIEWAVTPEREIMILQSRDIKLAGRNRQVLDVARGKTILRGGVSASPGRCVGVARQIHSAQDVERWRNDGQAPGIMVLHQSLVDAAGWLPEFEGVVVDLGNPADHLSCVAREYSRPMLTGTGKATEVLQDGQWVILDADAGMVLQAPEEIWADAQGLQRKRTAEVRRAAPEGIASPEMSRLRDLIEPLNLTDAYGPTFSIRECKSLHDIVRYTHEMAVLAMFNLGDGVLDEAEILVRRLDEGMPFHFFIIDLGGGIAPDRKGFKIRLADVLSIPLLALWEGMSTPGLRWSQPPPVAGLSELFSRSMMDGRSARPIGNQNYALITRDYLNLNARVDYHFTMIDAVCGANPKDNYIRFRFKGGGTSAVQRERRARFVTEVLQEHHFFTDRQGDLVNGSIIEMQREEIEERLVMLGRLIGFSRLLDATMHDDTVPKRVAQAFLEGDYGLRSMQEEFAAGT